MNKLEKILINISKLDQNKILREVLLRKEVQGKIIELNTRGQLFDRGIDSTGKTLESIGGSYAPSTIEGRPGLFKGKRELGLPFDRITLFNTGDFYQTFKIVIGNDFFTIKADPVKEDTNLFSEWGLDVVGLTLESKEILSNFILNDFILETKKAIFKGV